MADLILQLTEGDRPMLHVVYAGDVHPDEAISEPDIRPILGFRVKTSSGRYYHVFADSREAAEAWAAAQTNGTAPAAPTVKERLGGFLGLGRKKNEEEPA
jgi:hypothetical protein